MVISFKLIAEKIENQIQFFIWFYKILKLRLFIAFFLTLGAGLMDGLGLTLFFPLLESTNKTESKIDQDDISKFTQGLFEFLSLEQSLKNLLTLIILFFIGKALFKYCTEIYKVITQRMFIEHLKKQIISDFHEIDYESEVKIKSGRIQNITTVEIERMQLAYMYYFQTLEQFILISIYSFFAYQVNSAFAFVIVLGAIASNLFFKKLYALTKNLSFEFTEENNKFQSSIISVVKNFKYLKATDISTKSIQFINGNIEKIENIRERIGKINGLLVSLREPILIFLVFGTIYVQVSYYGESISSIIVALLLFYRALNSMTSLQGYWNRFLGVNGSIFNIQNILKYFNDHKEETGENIIGSIENIEFSAVELVFDKKTILKDINIKIPAKKMVGIIGKSGSGKTTLLNLITALIQPTSGKICINGFESKEINKESLRNQIAYITQEPIIFNGSIFENVTLFRSLNSKTLKRFWKVIDLVELRELIEGFPGGYKQEIDVNAKILSGGQRQRLAIARELFKNPSILLIDEGTSSLDKSSERRIVEIIEGLKGTCTIISVSHNVDTLKNFDTIIEIKDSMASEVNKTE